MAGVKRKSLQVIAALLLLPAVVLAPSSDAMPTAAAASAVTASTGADHTLILLASGSVWALGSNYFGQLGNSNHLLESATPGRPAPVVTDPVRVNGLPTAVSVTAGDETSFVIDVTGSLWAFGINRSGQLGTTLQLDTGVPISTPIKVQGLSNVIAVSPGYLKTAVLLADGTVWQFGRLNAGAISPAPHRIEGLSNVIAIAAAGGLDLESDGSVWGYGSSNAYGQHGTPPMSDATTPRRVSGLPPAVAIDSDEFTYSLVVGTDGSVWSFGRDDEGQLGYPPAVGVTSAPQSPQRVPGISNAVDVNAISSGSSIVLLADGSMKAFGLNSSGQLGTTVGFGAPNPRVPPTIVTGVNDAVRLGTGLGAEQVFIRRDGSVWGFGINNSGMLGYSPYTDTAPGYSIRPIFPGVVAGDSIVSVDSGIPSTASAIMANLTMTDAAAPGYITADRCPAISTGPQTRSSGNYSTGTPIANLSVVPVDVDGRFCIYNQTPVNEIVDVQGYFAPPATLGLAYTATQPHRVLDTRAAPLVRPFAGSITRVVTSAPSGAAAVLANLTMVDGLAAGYITADRCSVLAAGEQTKSSGNHSVAAAIANLSVLPIDSDGSFCIYNQQAVDLIVDIQGYFGNGADGQMYFPTQPHRVLDTR